jgi:divalent metal cation (Fe/Co/Zn/Cd) transporter
LERAALIRQAFRLEWLTITWMVVEGVVAIGAGLAFSERADRTASRIGGALLFTLAAYIVGGAAWSLWTRYGVEFSLPGLIVAVLTTTIMLLLPRRKLAIATQLGSRGMRADSAETITCSWLSLVVVGRWGT